MRVREIDPLRYAQSRNYGDGAVTRLSPYISRGVISTRHVYEYIVSLEISEAVSEKLIQELAWRDYWQQVWIAKGDAIHTHLKQAQKPVSNFQIPKAIVEASTGIEVVDTAIRELYRTGYMHNHMRMYVAAICCNMAHSHWLAPAKWMYSHLLDGDIASNQLSWQWVAGAFSNNKYYANQENINRFFHSDQKNTFLDVPYERFENMETPIALRENISLKVGLHLPNIERSPALVDQPTLVYNYYNVNPDWHKGESFQRVLLLEPSQFETYPVHQKCIDFMIGLSENIPEIKVFVGELDELLVQVSSENIIYKEHPLNAHYQGFQEPRDWLSTVTGYYPSFFLFGKSVRKNS
ncbi:FAD-binding domain-containing protein [Cyclobacterium qasimii]|uniref:Deoxyribodipyrimidine photolyase n=1 Tax=Cyclobacterium qasimii M12-11B TaxID=641524 RepID=S7VNN6_9BACT|nr:FAD-binding domain-containing protein [Cyclobacterium qasimii]EPR71825.1 Deoxyribodipyrimidine photolyase [Cyclobacterium qasimii M12-11B]